MTDSYQGQERLPDAGSDYNAMDFIVRQIAGRMATCTLVIVRAVNGDGTVDIQPMVAQIDGEGNATPHGIIHGAPFMRVQGGTAAIIIDPVVGDIGIAVFGREDLSSVKANKAPSNPGSRRRYSYSDALYIGGLLNGTPTQSIQIGPMGTTITDPNGVTVNSPRTHFTGDITTGAGSTFNGKSFDSHVHSGVATGSGNSGPPV